MGKIPCIDTERGFLSEAYAIADYLDSIQPEPRLLPADAFARAKAIELCRHLELDVELVARRCLPGAFFGAPLSDEVKASTEQDLSKGARAVDQLLVCGPYAAGSEFCLADIYAYYCLGLARAIVEKIFRKDLLDSIPRARDLLPLVGQQPSIQRVEAEKTA
jgi:glutathione S-transferase